MDTRRPIGSSRPGGPHHASGPRRSDGSRRPSARRFALVPLALLIVPIIEIALFIVIGERIGLGWTLLGILLTAIGGTVLLRIQGFRLIERIRTEMRAGRVPGRELAHGFLLLVAGILLLTPGFFTDALGFLLFVPAVRDAIWGGLKAKLFAVVPGAGLAAGMMGGGPDSGLGGGLGGGFGSPFRSRERGGDGVVDLGRDEYEAHTPPDSSTPPPADRDDEPPTRSVH